MKQVLFFLLTTCSLMRAASAAEIFSDVTDDFSYLADRVWMFHYEFEGRDYLEVITCNNEVFVNSDPIKMRCQAGLGDFVSVYYIVRDDVENLSYFKFIREDSQGVTPVNSIVYFLILNNGVRSAELAQYKEGGSLTTSQLAAVRQVKTVRSDQTDRQVGFSYTADPIRISLQADGGRPVYDAQAGNLVIPDIKVGTTSYNVSMQRTSDNLEFKVTKAKKNP